MKMFIFFRSVCVLFLLPVSVMVYGGLAIIAHYVFRSRPLEDKVCQQWGQLICWLSGVRVRLHGVEKLPAGGYLVLFNHASFFDIFALIAGVKGLRFGAKAELFKIPVFAQAMRAVGTLPIARDNREQVIRIYEEAKKRFAQGEKFALSPEGGRFYNAKKLSTFKSGPFIFAISAGVPVVPTVVIGAYEILPKGEMLFNKNKLSTYVDVYFLDPVPTVDISFDNRHQLSLQVYEKMNKVWEEHSRANSP